MEPWIGTQRLGTIPVSINGRTLRAHEGESVLDCALRHDIAIPHLCTHPDLPAFGACRMCLVEVEERSGFLTACTTPVEKGMVVQTDTPALRTLRRHILELILLEHPSGCLFCDKKDLCEEYRPAALKVGRTTGCHTCNNKEVCEIRAPVGLLGPIELPVPPLYRGYDVERSDPFIDRDLNLCILCGRCVRICRMQHGRTTIAFVGRGTGVHIGEAFGRSLLEAGCRFCGSCVDVCPTGALADRYAKWQAAGRHRVETTCMLCDRACALSVRVSGHNRAVSARAVNGTVPVCVLGRFAIPEFLSGADRLTAPKVKVGSVMREVGWPEALRQLAQRLESYRGPRFAAIGDASGTLEDRAILEAFTIEVMDSPHYLEARTDGRGRPVPVHLPQGVRATFLTGAFVDPSALAGLDVVAVQDCYPSPVGDAADVVLPAAVLAEVEGSVLDGEGVPRPVRRASAAPGKARPDWEILCALAREMGAPGFDPPSVTAITKERLGVSPAGLWIFRDATPVAADDPALRRTHYRGHELARHVRGLRELPLTEASPAMAAAQD